MISPNESPEGKRAEALFDARREYEALWETAYRFIAPERAVFFRNESRSPNEVGDEIFDSTAIDSAERLTNLIMSGLTPPWARWFRLQPGASIRDPQLREQLRPLLELAEDKMLSVLRQSNFYQELQPLLLDRIVGGTGALKLAPTGTRLRFKSRPLAEVAIHEDNAGEVTEVALRYKLSLRDLQTAYPDRIPPDWVRKQPRDDRRDKLVYELHVRDPADGIWAHRVVLKETGTILEQDSSLHPRMFVTRWSKVPGSAYGRGPGLRVLADVRALNKLKELSLKNAALTVSGVFLVADDGVVNPYTLVLEPGARIPVAENNVNSPPIAELPTSRRFDVSEWSMDELRNSIKSVFMNDQFQPLGRTPLSATEVAERTRVLAQDMGATIARLQYELLVPVLRAVFAWLAERGELPPELEIDDTTLQLEFVSQLAQAQWAQDVQNILQMAGYAIQFGEFDARAGLAVDSHAALRKIAELQAVPSEVMRTEQEIAEIMEQQQQAQAMMEGEGDGVE